MKTLLNIAAIKKNAKEGVNYYRAPEKTFIWDKKGYFAFMVSNYLFDEELRKNIITFEQTDLPPGIKNIFMADYSNYNIITRTTLYIEMPNLKNPAHVLKCYTKNYFTIVNPDFIKMLNYIETYTIYQDKENAPLMFISDVDTILIMPLRNNGIKEQLETIINN